MVIKTDITPGKRQGWLTLIGVSAHPCRGYQCLVRCDCGREFTVGLSKLRGTRDCGCLRQKQTEAVERLWKIARWFIPRCCEGEQWKWIAGAECRDLVSSCGRVYSMRLQRLLPGTPDHAGYLMVYLGAGRNRRRAIHLLVLTAFGGSRPDEMQVRHLDGNQLNSHLFNLKWGTAQENTDDKYLHGTVPLGEAHHGAVLTDDLVRLIRLKFAEGQRNIDISRSLGIHDNTVRAVLKGWTWSHVT